MGAPTPDGPPRYGYPVLMRAGLANMLAPWVRCFVWCRAHGAQMLAPRWFKLRLGPYVRHESDKRQYQRLFSADGYLRGPRKALVLATARRIDELELPISGESGASRLVCFRGLERFLWPAIGHSAEVAEELRRITRPQLLPPASSVPFVAIHVRMGDFQPPDESALRAGAWNLRIPLDWYTSVIGRLQERVGGRITFRLFSDGSAEELRELLALPDVELVTGTTALTDLFDIAQAKGLIASGSTFSIWASFLGQLPTIWFPGQFRRSIADPSRPLTEIQWHPDDGVLPVTVVRSIVEP